MTHNINETLSNADAVKLIGREKIMKSAWMYYRASWARCATFGAALVKAWADARRKAWVAVESVRYAKEAKAATDAAAAKREAAKAAYTGDKKTRSPLNPHWDSMGRLSGKMGGAYTSTIVGR